MILFICYFIFISIGMAVQLSTVGWVSTFDYKHTAYVIATLNALLVSYMTFSNYWRVEYYTALKYEASSDWRYGVTTRSRPSKQAKSMTRFVWFGLVLILQTVYCYYYTEYHRGIFAVMLTGSSTFSLLGRLNFHHMNASERKMVIYPANLYQIIILLVLPI